MGFVVTEMPFSQVMNHPDSFTDTLVFYTFSQRDNLRHYIKDIIHHLVRQGARVIPSESLLHCHENKGYQELLKRELGITDLPAWYLSSKRELAKLDIQYPVVLKTLEGSNGRGVFLIRSKPELLTQVAALEPRLSLLTKLDLVRRRYFRQSRHFQEYPDFSPKQDYFQYKDYITPEIPFVIQHFVPHLQYDYRVIVLGERFYVTKRLTRQGDFRASGAKRFTFDFQASDRLLQYALDLYKRFNTPFLSLDIGEADDRYYLFEFQASHFGINAIKKGKGFYVHEEGHWTFHKADTVFEEALASGLLHYLKEEAHGI